MRSDNGVNKIMQLPYKSTFFMTQSILKLNRQHGSPFNSRLILHLTQSLYVLCEITNKSIMSTGVMMISDDKPTG